MADHTTPVSQTELGENAGHVSNKPRTVPLHKLYALPVPIRTFPLPNFYPNNPLSLIHVLWAWAKEVISPPPAEPSIVHQAFWSAETRSVHVRDPKSIRALWEQGFFGKGNYSRSEPHWLKGEQIRMGKQGRTVAELNTTARREERKLAKWERARKEQEAILKTKLEEAWLAPVGPKELLALPNSAKDIAFPSSTKTQDGIVTPEEPDNKTVRDVSLNALAVQGILNDSSNHRLIDDFKDTIVVPAPIVLDNASITPPKTPSSTSSATSQPGSSPTPKRRKSVRFSPRVESQTFQFSDPPSPHLGSSQNGKAPTVASTSETTPLPQPDGTVSPQAIDTPTPEVSEADVPDIVDREHLQLSPEEAFYLVYALGVLSITDPVSGKTLTVQDLFGLFRQMSYFPQRTADLQPDDPFLVQYVVYHHFRSLGWVPRSGVKFGADWLLYLGGPVFTHGEFAVTVIPSYSHPYWKSRVDRSTKRSWHWLHSIGRVQSHALKTLVLVYVDIPPPTDEPDISGMLKRYKVREFCMKRFLVNRNCN
ncbi:hypothetical protein F5Y16DRAFT_389244 [Xylariaceae sp. FL0255]|nr:hypothetical protein F5Y16DRAFT_389244 [Xylariaceae sp. FL0255]